MNAKRLGLPILTSIMLAAAISWSESTCSALTVTPAAPLQGKPKSKTRVKHDAQIKLIYDKTKDETVALLDEYPLVVDTMNGFSELTMKAYFRYSGTNPRQPETITFDFVWSDYDFRFEKTTNVTARIDGEQVDLGVAERVATIGVPSGGEAQRLVLYVPYNLFTRIINTKKDFVELRMRGYFYFRKDTLAALRHLASLANQ